MYMGQKHIISKIFKIRVWLHQPSLTSLFLFLLTYVAMQHCLEWNYYQCIILNIDGRVP
jgi:hypothetical protein